MLGSEIYEAFTFELGDKFSKNSILPYGKKWPLLIFFLYFSRVPTEIDLFFKLCSSNLNACIFPDSAKLSNLDKPRSPLPKNNDVNLSLLIILLNLIEVKYCLISLRPVNWLEVSACSVLLRSLLIYP